MGNGIKHEKKHEKKHRRSVLCLLLTCSMLLLAACGKKENDGETVEQANNTIENRTESAEELNVEASTESTQQSTVANDSGNVSNYGYTIPELSFAKKEIPNTDAFVFVENMGIGWNLGNTLDAVTEDPWFDSELGYESAWCGITTTPEMIKAVKDAGFSTIRIPVSWHNHVSGSNFQISEVWMNRVKEIVDYAIDLDMYVIINIHHDILNGYGDGEKGQCFIYPSEEYYSQSEYYLTCVWQQLCVEFQDYDEHLIFESMNEPRLKGSSVEWWLDPNSTECAEAVACINRLNQKFVDIVRASGGNNANRYLLIPGYCTSLDGVLNEGFSLPDDSVENKLLVAVHAYTPYNFALQGEYESGSKSTFDASNSADTTEIDYLMNSLYDKYVSKGIPVVIDEFGARRKNSTDPERDNTQSRIDYAAYYTASARANGISCCWWDNNSFDSDGEDFGLLNRSAIRWGNTYIVHALIQYGK